MEEINALDMFRTREEATWKAIYQYEFSLDDMAEMNIIDGRVFINSFTPAKFLVGA